MMEKLKLSSGKTVKFPSRIFKSEDLLDMGISSVEENIFLNKVHGDSDFPTVSSEIKKNMAIINYSDFSDENFSASKLSSSVKKQLQSDSDFIVLSCFKNETPYDIREKLNLAGEIKWKTEKAIILEVGYKSEIDTQELIKYTNNFDFLSVFYGLHYGHFNQLHFLVRRIIELKESTGKRVLCMAVPLKFSGDNIQDVCYMPCYDLIGDAWVKNWKRGGGNEKIKVIDPKDFKSKTYTQWLETGHQPNDVLMIINRNIYEIFKPDARNIRQEYERLMSDEILIEIRKLTPFNVENFVFSKFHTKYVGLILLAYREKVIQNLFKQSEIFSEFSDQEKKLLESKLREQRTPARVYDEINYLKKCIEQDKIKSVPLLIKEIEDNRLQE